jgi:hypothetical protein
MFLLILLRTSAMNLLQHIRKYLFVESERSSIQLVIRLFMVEPVHTGSTL